MTSRNAKRKRAEIHDRAKLAHDLGGCAAATEVLRDARVRHDFRCPFCPSQPAGKITAADTRFGHESITMEPYDV